MLKRVQLFHRTQPHLLPHIEKHGLLPPKEAARHGVPLIEQNRRTAEERRQADEFVDKFAPPGIKARRKDAIFLSFSDEGHLVYGTPNDDLVGISVKVDPEKCRVFDMQTYNNVQRYLNKTKIDSSAGQMAKDLARWYWHFSLPLNDFLRYYEKPKKGTIWKRKAGAPEKLADGFWWPEVLTMEKIEPEHVDVSGNRE